MEPEDLEHFSSFLKEFQGETDRGAALVGAALVDNRLEHLLKAHLLAGKTSDDLIKGSEAPLGTLSSRIKMAYALGLITQLEFEEANLIRRVRNEFAHGLHGLTFANQKLRALCNNFKANTPGGLRCAGDPRRLSLIR